MPPFLSLRPSSPGLLRKIEVPVHRSQCSFEGKPVDVTQQPGLLFRCELDTSKALMTPCGGLLQRHIQSISAAHPAGFLHILGSHPSSKSRGLCRTYAAAVVSEIEQHSPVNGSSPPLDALNAAVAARRSLPTSPETLDLPPYGFDSIESALEALRQGHMVVVLDDEDRENEGDLIMAADKVSNHLSRRVS